MLCLLVPFIGGCPPVNVTTVVSVAQHLYLALSFTCFLPVIGTCVCLTQGALKAVTALIRPELYLITSHQVVGYNIIDPTCEMKRMHDRCASS